MVGGGGGGGGGGASAAAAAAAAAASGDDEVNEGDLLSATFDHDMYHQRQNQYRLTLRHLPLPRTTHQDAEM